MDIKKYLTLKAVWERKVDIDPDTRMPVFADPVIIDCFKYGKGMFIRGDNDAAHVSARSYLVLDDVQPEDKLDGQVVQSVNDFPESWDDKVVLHEVLTWYR